MDKSQLFKRAWYIAKTTGKNFAICLVKAWELYKLKKALAKRKVKFAYEKVNGELRYAVGTLEEKFLGDVKGLRKPNIKVLSYYDLDAMAFRCFRIENLVKVY